MMMNRSKLFVLIVMLAVTSACGKVEPESEGISFMPEFLAPTTWITTQNPATKGAPVVTGTDFSFKVSAYTASNSVYINDQTVEYDSNDIWSTSALYFWPGNSSLFFSAYSPLDLQTAYDFAFTADTRNMQFEYTSPLTAAEQPDIVLSSFEASNGVSTTTLNNKMVPLTFYHATSAVKFLITNVPAEYAKVKSIKIKNIYTSGSCVFSGTSYTWSGWGDSGNVSQTYNKALTSDQLDAYGRIDITSDASKVFMPIPQNVTGAELEMVVETTSATELTLSVALPVNWVAGHVYRYVISCEIPTITIATVIVDPYEEGASSEISFD